MNDRSIALTNFARPRDNGRVGQTLDRLRVAHAGTENTMPYLWNVSMPMRRWARSSR